MAEPTIYLPEVLDLIQKLSDATNTGNQKVIGERWKELQDTIAPCPPLLKEADWRGDPGRVGTIIVASELNDETKRTLVKLLREMTTGNGPHDFVGPYSKGAELLKATLAALSPKKSPNDPRDSFAYKQRSKTKSYKSIMYLVNEQIEKRGRKWEPLTSPQGVRQALMSFAKRQCLPWPPLKFKTVQ